MAAAVTAGEDGAAAQELVSSRVSGRMVVWNSRAGRAVLQATGLVPGKMVAGTVRIKNRGRRTVVLRLKRSAVASIAGPYGGKVSGRLHLTIRDVTRRARPRVVYRGPITGGRAMRLGILKPRQKRDFRFEVRFLETPASAVYGSSDAEERARLSLRWYGVGQRGRRLKIGQLRSRRVAGPVVLTSARRGTAQLSTGSLSPGMKTSATISVRSRVRQKTTVKLARTTLIESLTAHGQGAASRLQMVITDVSKRRRPRVVYRGALATTKIVKLGTLKPRGTGKYRFDVRYPKGAPSDNVYMGSKLQLSFVWYATPRR